MCFVHLSWRYCGNDIDKRTAGAHVRPDYFAMRMEFSLNDFHWIHLIVTKSKNGKITRDAPCLAGEKIPDEAAKTKLLWLYGKDTYPKVVKKIYFLLLLPEMYLLPGEETLGQCTIFGFCHDSVHFVNSVKLI